MEHRDSDLEGSMDEAPKFSPRFLNQQSNNENDMSDPDDDSPDDAPNGSQTPLLTNIKQETRDVDVGKILSASGVGGGVGGGQTPQSLAAPPPFSIPMQFPFPHPPFPSPASVAPYQQQTQPSSASSHSSESSSSSQQTWSFEEQFKQVRQLYELSDDPKRKEFLDDLFLFMQKRGTPINRLPIMAKSVLDLYELYNLVIQRGGLVDVINKKLWQEIIKGLHLPSSITSAAFTLRTQYMKYLYPYECEKRRLSTPGELQAAIDGNRREGRRGSYGTYAEMMTRSPGGFGGGVISGVGGAGGAVSVASAHSPIGLVTARAAVAAAALNGGSHHHHSSHHHHNNNNHIPPHQAAAAAALLPPAITGSAGMAPAEFEARMVEYVKLLNKELRSSATTPPINSRQTSPTGGPGSPPEGSAAAGGGISPLEMSRLTLWNLYHHTPPVAAVEPQKEALNLEKRLEDPIPPPPPPKRHYPDNSQDDLPSSIGGAHIKISSRGEGRGGNDNSLVVSMDINGIMYQGVLFAQTTPRSNRLQS